MIWTKLGRVFVPDGAIPWMRSHASVPFAEPLDGDHVRIFFSSRDAENRSRVGSLVFDMSRLVVEAVAVDPVLGLGPLGAFDDHGVVGSWVVREADRWLLFYTGWTLGVTVPFYLFDGLATSADGEHFERVSPAPILPRSETDPFLTGVACVLRGDGWRMWYVSGVGWERRGEEVQHRYHIKHAESLDGLSWRRTGRVCVDFEGDEVAIARPSVVKDAEVYRMWFCSRGASYRIGYAESLDGLTWRRLDGSVGIQCSEDGWDSEMLAYPFVFDHRGQRYMLYNGNQYGRTGFGLARLDMDAGGRASSQA